MPIHADSPPEASGRFGLVVVPDAQTSRVCERVLLDEGLHPVVVDDGAAALAVVEARGAPAIVVTELSLPLVDGFELLKELRKRFAVSEMSAVVVSAFAHLRDTAARLQEDLGIAWIVTGDAAELFIRHAVHQALEGTESREPEPPPVERHQDPQRAERMNKMGLVDDRPPDDVLQAIVADTAQMFDVPVALVSLVLQDRQWFKAYCGLGGDILEARGTPIDAAFCRHVVDAGRTLVVPDATTNPYFESNPLVREGIVGSYAGAPLITPAGDVLGTLCIIDGKPLGIGPRRVKALEALARRVVGEIQLTIARRKPNTPSIQSALSVLDSSMNSLDNGVLLFGPDRRVQFVNEAFGRILDVRSEEIQSSSREDVLRQISGRTENPTDFRIRLEMPSEGSFAFRGDFVLPGTPARRIRWIEEPVPTEQGPGQACFVRDVTLEKEERPLESRAGEGPVAEQSWFDRSTQAILRQIIRAREDGHPISLVLFDVRTAEYNDPRVRAEVRSRAHRRMNRILQDCAEDAGVVLPWGNHEYLAALPRLGSDAAQVFVDRVQQAMTRAGDAAEIFAGVAELQGDDDLHLALAEAGARLRRSKQTKASGSAGRSVVGPRA